VEKLIVPRMTNRVLGKLMYNVLLNHPGYMLLKIQKKNHTYLLTNHGPVRSLDKGFIRLIDPGSIQLATGFNYNNIQAEISSQELQSRPKTIEDY